MEVHAATFVFIMFPIILMVSPFCKEVGFWPASAIMLSHCSLRQPASKH